MYELHHLHIFGTVIIHLTLNIWYVGPGGIYTDTISQQNGKT